MFAVESKGTLLSDLCQPKGKILLNSRYGTVRLTADSFLFGPCESLLTSEEEPHRGWKSVKVHLCANSVHDWCSEFSPFVILYFIDIMSLL